MPSSTGRRRKRRKVGLETKDKSFRLLEVKEEDPNDEVIKEVVREGSTSNRTVVKAPGCSYQEAELCLK